MRRRKVSGSASGAPGSSVSRAAARLRTRVAAAAAVLEKAFGTPRRASPAPPLDMLVATILSQNTSDTNSHRAYQRLRDRYPTWARVAGAPVRGLVAALRPGGMALQKARRLKSVLQRVQNEAGQYSLDHLAGLPTAEAMEYLLRFDGVGPKTGACVLLFSLGRDVFPVDTHVHRICGRLGLARGCRTPEETFHVMAGLVPAGKAHSFHSNLIRFGRALCRARDPLCGSCPLYAECTFPGRRERRRIGRHQTVQRESFLLLDSIQG